MDFKQAPIPPASPEVFAGGIDHPRLWLWDSWTLLEPSGLWHLYCLALSKVDADGNAIAPPARNNFAFHVRRFESCDQGQSWFDRGVMLEPRQVRDGADARNVWSGSVLRLDDGRVAFGFTGVRDCGPDRSFLQTICVATGSDPSEVKSAPFAAISCPLRDYDAIVARGYYLGPRETLGSNEGEAGGPILAWRDPFLFATGDGELHAVWSAKLSPTLPALAHARLKQDDDQISLTELCAPITLPDAALMTQAEVPKVYFDPETEDYLLLVSACDRRFEGQPDCELTHTLRLYRSRDIRGPWRTFRASGSALPGLDGLFGASLIRHDITAGRLSVIGPYTENSGPERQLQFAQTVDLHIETGAKSDCTQIA